MPSALDKLKQYAVDEPLEAAGSGVEALKNLFASSEEEGPPEGYDVPEGYAGLLGVPQEPVGDEPGAAAIAPPAEQSPLSHQEALDMQTSYMMGDHEGFAQILGQAGVRALGDLQLQPPELLESPDYGAEDYLMSASTEMQTAASDLADMYDQFQESVLPDLREAEQEARQMWEDADIELEYGMPADEVYTMQETIARAQEYPDDVALQQEAREAHKKLAEAQKTAAAPDPHRLWSNAATWKKALFILINAIGSGGAAMAGLKRTPMDVVFELMDRDYEAQKAEYMRRKGKVADLRSAYSMAARKTDSEMQRMAMAKNIMMAPMEAHLRAANMLQGAETLASRRAQMMNDAVMSRFGQKQQNSRAILATATQDRLSRLRLSIGQGAEQMPPFGTQYVKGAPPLDKTAKRQVQGALGQYAMIVQATQDLLELRRSLGLGEKIVSAAIDDPTAADIRNLHSQIIDGIRKYYKWGARFEKTEAEVLVRGYLGTDNPVDIDLWGGVTAGLARFLHDLPIRLQADLYKGYGLMLTPQGAGPSPGEME